MSDEQKQEQMPPQRPRRTLGTPYLLAAQDEAEESEYVTAQPSVVGPQPAQETLGRLLVDIRQGTEHLHELNRTLNAIATGDTAIYDVLRMETTLLLGCQPLHVAEPPMDKDAQRKLINNTLLAARGETLWSLRDSWIEARDTCVQAVERLSQVCQQLPGPKPPES